MDYTITLAYAPVELNAAHHLCCMQVAQEKNPSTHQQQRMLII